MSGALLLREIPAALVDGVASGRYGVRGSIIRDLASGRVLGHLQEAGGLAELAEIVGAGPLAPVKAAVDAVRLVQTEQLKAGLARVETGIGSLAQLGAANLALGAVGIGVSVAGQVVLARKIDHLKRVVDSVADRLADKVDQVGRELVQLDLDDLAALGEAFEIGWLNSPASAEREWARVAYDAARFAARFERRAHVLLADGPANVPLAEPMLDALAAAGGLQVAARAAAGQSAAAQSAARANAVAIDALTGDLGLADLAIVRVRDQGVEPGTEAWGHALTAATESVRPDICRLRDREAAAATRAAPLIELERRGVVPRDWMEEARAEKGVAVLLLPASDGAAQSEVRP